MRWLPATIAFLLVALPAAATTIGAILDAPASFDGQQVTVTGTVVGPVPAYRGESAFNLQDGDRRISVFSTRTAPPLGQHLQVTGKVGYKPPDEEFTWPPLILESGRQVLP